MIEVKDSADQPCSRCGAEVAELAWPTSVRRWLCPDCFRIEYHIDPTGAGHPAEPPEDTEPLDDDGYPAPATLDRIRKWDPRDGTGLLEYVGGLWRYPRKDYFATDDRGVWHVSTGGWSGNEDLIGAMTENSTWWTLHWQMSKRGGHHEFAPRQLVGPTLDPNDYSGRAGDPIRPGSWWVDGQSGARVTVTRVSWVLHDGIEITFQRDSDGFLFVVTDACFRERYEELVQKGRLE